MNVRRRHLATLLSADVFGYSRHMAEDEEVTLATLQSYRELASAIVGEGHGRMFGVAGDSWMAEFCSPVEALNCAVKIQREIEARNEALPTEQRLRFRMGLHLGDVLERGEDLFGGEVNIAARLQQAAPPGGLVLSDAVFVHVAGKVEIKFDALGPRRFKNIPKLVTAYEADVHGRPLCCGGCKAAEDFDLSQPVPGFAGKPALAVLPFDNLGKSASDEYLGDGFAEDLITRLSQVRWFPVISSRSSFVYRSSSLDPRTIGGMLGARYLLTGSMRLAGQNLRLTVNLVDSENGVNIWNRRYDTEFKNMFEAQDDISASIVSVLDSEIDKAEQLRTMSRKQEDLDNWEIIRRGIWHLNMMRREEAAKARLLFEEALRRDPHSGEARIQLAWWYFWDVWNRRASEDGLHVMERLAREAMAIDARDARARLLIGIALLMMRRPVEGRDYLREAVEMNPSLAAGYATIGSTHILAGEPAKGVAPLLLSMRLNPQDPHSFHFLGELAMAYHMQGQWGKACEYAERSLQLRPGYWYAKAVLIASLARSGRVKAAKAAMLECHSSACVFSEKQINWLPFVHKKWNEYLIIGLRLAGCHMADRETKPPRIFWHSLLRVGLW